MANICKHKKQIKFYLKFFPYMYCKKGYSDFPFPSRDFINQR
jgi:hypothetical protein